MKGFRKIRDFFAIRKIEKAYRNNNSKRKVCNITAAKKVGIVFNYSDSDFIEEFKKSPEFSGKDVSFISYENEKNRKTDYRNTTTKNNFLIFNKSSLNWYGKPDDKIVGHFIDTDYDILIDMNQSDCLPLKYIVASSKASFKVGRRQTLLSDIYDIILDLGSSHTIRDYSKQVFVYLNMINSK